MKADAKCFIRVEKGIYEEIPYKELEKRRLKDEFYKVKKFIPIDGMLMEVTLDEYIAFYKEIERAKYYKRKSKEFEFISINEIPEEKDIREKYLLIDEKINIDFEVERKIEIEKLRKALLLLTEDEYKLIKNLFYDDKSLRYLANKLGKHHTTVQHNRDKILKKLRNFIKEYKNYKKI